MQTATRNRTKGKLRFYDLALVSLMPICGVQYVNGMLPYRGTDSIKQRSLAYTCYYFGIEITGHRALDQAQTTRQVLIALARTSNVVTTKED